MHTGIKSIFRGYQEYFMFRDSKVSVEVLSKRRQLVIVHIVSDGARLLMVD